ncbi:meiotic check point regulator-like protein [Achlya hypogyna]|uniref:Meiotic check point regulator-like protein n=1 Tax=Achlya hypogyna TaxID=1202772 RepID=A0A1V9YSV6_ACHHY|nr:meiotic check point regulator-like protein [Achlya hypogyna]
MLFSLSHPLEEIKPVVLQLDTTCDRRNCMFVADPRETVVHVHQWPPFIVFYHHDACVFALKRIVSSAPSVVKIKPNSIVPEIVLETIWTSPVLPPTADGVRVFVASDVDATPLLGIMHPPSQQLLLQRLSWSAEALELTTSTATPTCIKCLDAVSMLHERESTFGYDLILQMPNEVLALYRGTHYVCTLDFEASSERFDKNRARLFGGGASPIQKSTSQIALNIPTSLDTLQLLQSSMPNSFALIRDGLPEEFSLPLSLASRPLLDRVFAVLDAILPPLLALKFRIHVVAGDDPWSTFVSSLVAAPSGACSAASVFDKLRQSAFHHKYRGLPLSSVRKPTPLPRAPHTTLPEFLPDLQARLVDIFRGLHLLYEDLKLSSLMMKFCCELADVLAPLAAREGWTAYVAHYAADVGPRHLPAAVLASDPFVGQFDAQPVDIMAWIQRKMATHHFNVVESKKLGALRSVARFPTLDVLERTRHVVELYERLYPATPAPLLTRANDVVAYLGPEHRAWEDIPMGVALPIKYAIYVCKHFPRDDFGSDECLLVNRPDLQPGNEAPPRAPAPPLEGDVVESTKDNDDGLPDVVVASQTLFPRDQRLKEVVRLLRSNKPMYLKVAREAHHSDADVLALQQARLLLLCKRAMALSVARGMVTIGSLPPATVADVSSPYTSRLPIPQMPLTARIAGSNAKTVLDISGYKEITHWPQFHNGVATSLRLSPADRVTVQWVLSHQPKRNTEESDEAVRAFEEACAGHAGFLFGLGLQGQLQCQSPTTTYKYLSLGDELTSVGFLLGTAASTLHHPKDMNVERAVAKMLSMHIPSLWPPSFSHLHVPPSAQTAAVMGLGLLYLGTGNRLMTEFLLTEMTQGPVVAGAAANSAASPSTEMVQYEGYAFATGCALGLILLGRRSDPGLVDLDVDAKLTKYMLGGEKEPGHGMWSPMELNCVLRTRKKGSRDCINVDVTASGAALALAFMFMWSNNTPMGQRLRVPATLVLLETIRPDVLFVRVVASNLVLWAAIEPTPEWVARDQVPPPLRPTGPHRWASGDPSTVQEAYANIVAGACFSIGLKFAGTQHPVAKATLIGYIEEVQDWRAKLGRSTDVSRVTLERVLGTLAQALALVMVGTGDIECTRLIRALLVRQKADVLGDVTYGNHMAMSSALGLLYLGGGRCSLLPTPLATAMLVVALYPMYPSKTTDQRYHLQALRHLYVLAIDRTRLLEALDVDTQRWASIPVQVWTTYQETPLQRLTPSLLPAARVLRRLEIDSKSHFPIRLDWTATDNRAKLLWDKGVLRIKRRQGADEKHTFLSRFRALFSTPSALGAGVTTTMWLAFCSRVHDECRSQNKPDLVSLYLNAKRCEQSTLTARLSNTLIVANLQLMQLHMELEAHVFQQRDENDNIDEVASLAQLINEDFTLGYSNALLAYFERLDLTLPAADKVPAVSCPASIEHAAYLRYLGSPLLAHLE